MRLGTRGSPLALAQAGWVRDRLKDKGIEAELVVITTSGDRNQEITKPEGGLKGLFVTEIHRALAAGEIDGAVHSLKDVPAELEEEFVLAAIPPREDPRDAWIGRGNQAFAALPPGSKVGTTSLRRRAQLLRARPDLEITDLRGNVDTRLRKVREGVSGLQGSVLALAGLRRLGLEKEIQSLFEFNEMLPAACQGALGLTARRKDPAAQKALALLDHRESREAVTAERAFLLALGADCQAPVGALAQVQGHEILLTGLVAAADGKRELRLAMTGTRGSAKSLGGKLAKRMLQMGGREILKNPS